MGTVKTLKGKFLVALIVFMLVFSNCGFTLTAIATSDEFQVITNGFFRKDEVKFKAYFVNENGKEVDEITGDVNEKVKLVLEILPQVEGFLKSGKIEAVAEDGQDLNFRITGVSKNLFEDEEERNKIISDMIINNVTPVNNEEDNSSENQNVVNEVTPENQNVVNEVSHENLVETSNIVSNENVVETNTVEENKVDTNTVNTNSISNENVIEENTVANEVSNSVTNEVTNSITNEPSNVVSSETNTVQNENTVSTTDIVNGMVSLHNSEQIVDGETNSVAPDINNPLMQFLSTNTVNEESINNVENAVENTVDSNNQVSNTVSNEVVKEEVVEETNINEEVIPNNTEENSSEENVAEVPDSSIESEELVNEEDLLIDEDEIIQEKIDKSKILAEMIANAILDVKVASDSEIELSNIVKDTKIEVELEFIKKETLNIFDLMKNIKLQLSGKYINSELEEVDVAKEEKIVVGWKYSKDFELNSEFTKFSPFEILDIKGTIVENKISVIRDITDKNYLPIKSTRLEVEVPMVNGKKPIEIDVKANKLMATKGEDTGYTTFNEENWKYDENTNKIAILVENDGYVFSKGADEFVIIYRYADYIEAENSNLLKSLKATVEEFSADENNVLTKEIREGQDIDIDVGELVTYDITTTENKINKAKIYANYNSEEAQYETDYTSQVNVNILTSDILEELKIDCTNEVYKDANGVEFKAEEIEYKNIRFNYNEVKSILSEGGEIVITDRFSNQLYTLKSELIGSEEDCSVPLNGARGIVVYVRNIAKNGTINFELTKTIKRCDYDRAVFKSFKEIESRITATVKYLNLDATLVLPTIGAIKAFSESKTSANISINQEYFNTTKTNENVELKISLNNDKEDSDLYINPAFELVFPKYVKSVSVNSINVLYDNGLRVSDFQTYTESDIVKMRIELEGKQTTFSENSLTNGTNIIINTNIDVDDYTPSKEDQIKLYYCNEGVSNYSAQTKWTISKSIPNNILKQTNGFDVTTLKYQGPSGLIAVNGITNYDGGLAELKSVKQGEVKGQVPRNAPSRIATMELLALNNTDNECTDVVLLGRIPFKGNTDIETGKDLGTNWDTVMVDMIKEDITNTNTTTIYYSVNAKADKNLDKESNGWTTTINDINNIKSFMIVVKGSVAPGQVLRYTYDFKIPENLPYEAVIKGSFGAFYNEVKSTAVVYSKSVADPVTLVTAVGPKLTAKMSVDVGDGADVLSNKRLKYVVNVSNDGSETANDVVVTCKIPAKTTLLQYEGRASVGDYGYVANQNAYEDGTFEINLGTIEPGFCKETTYYVKTGSKPTLEEYALKDENGYYIITDYEYEEVVVEDDHKEDTNENDNKENPHKDSERTEIKVTPIKEYITEVPDYYITNKASVTSSLSATEVETNEVKNRLNQANFASEIRLDFDREVQTGMVTNFTLLLENTSRTDLNNVVASLYVGDIYQFKQGSIDGKGENIKYEENEGKVYFYIGNMPNRKNVTLEACMMVNRIDSEMKQGDCYFDFIADGIGVEKSTVVKQTVVKPIIEASDMTITIPSKVNENNTVIISTMIKNISNVPCTEAELEFNISDNVDVNHVKGSIGGILSTKSDDNKYHTNIPTINAKSSMSVDIVLNTKNLPGKENSEALIKRVVHNTDQEDITLNDITFNITNNEKTTEEIEEERVNKLKEEADKNRSENDNSNKPSTETRPAEKTPTENNTQKPENNNNNTQKPENNNNNTQQPTNNNNNSQPTNNSNQSQKPTNKTNNNNNSNTKSQQTANKPTETNNVEATTYLINGISWLDANKDGIRDDNEESVSGVKVYLLSNDGRMLKSTTTAPNGVYEFKELTNGKYIVAVSFDEEKYTATTYKKAGVEENRTSNIIENTKDDISAATNVITIDNNNVGSVNIGLKTKDIFDLAIGKYISKITVENGKYHEEYEFDNLDITKVEIPSRKIEGSKVTLEYNIIIENVGEIDGYAKEVVDYINEGIEFDGAKNEDWYVGSDGNIYAKDLSQTILQKGEKKVLKLVLTKHMTADNTGTFSNKVALLSSYGSNTDTENSDNNVSVQNTLILISTGHTTQLVLFITILMMLAFVITVNKDKINISFLTNSTTYKTKTKSKVRDKIKNKTKKVYK